MHRPDPAPYRFFLRALAFAGLLAVALVAGSPLVSRSPGLARLTLGETALQLEALDQAPGWVAYAGDSVVHWGRHGPQPETTLAAQVAGRLGVGMVDLSQAGYGPRQHLAELRYLVREGAPRGLILGISPASLGQLRADYPGWSRGPRVALLETGLVLPVRLGQVFQARFGAISPAAFDARPLRREGRVLARLGELRAIPDLDRRERLLLLAHYGRDPARSPQWPHLQALLAELAAAPFPVFVYVTPVDIDLVRARLDGERAAQVGRHLDRLAAALAESGLPHADFSRRLKGAAFDRHAGETTEHLDPIGRRALAREVAAQARAALR